MSEDLLPELIVQSVSFAPDGFVEVSFMELRDQSEGAALAKHLVVDADLWSTEVDQIQELLRELVDEVLIHIRNPDAREARLKAIRERKAADEEDDES